MNDEQLSLRNFEIAADAIVEGDTATLRKLLGENAALIHERSQREHHATLLHYVSANGVENFRQKTPGNVLEIAQILLDAGADINAESEAYGGGATALGLTATSVHPERAGVQLALLELLIAHDARMDGSNGESGVNACLRNGRGQAAEFLASRGAQLNLEGAAGVGRLDLVKTFFDDRGRLLPPATAEQMKDGFAWACEFGHTDVVGFLLTHGMPINATLRHHGQTGLHWAAAGGHTEAVKLLLEHGADVNAKDEHFGGSPLDWARHGQKENTNGFTGREPHYRETIKTLVDAGGKPASSE